MCKSGRAPPVLTALRWLPPQGNSQAHVGTSVAPTPGDLAPTALPLALSLGLRRPLFRPPRCSRPSGSLAQGSPSSRHCPVHRHQVSLLKHCHAMRPSPARCTMIATRTPVTQPFTETRCLTFPNLFTQVYNLFSLEGKLHGKMRFVHSDHRGAPGARLRTSPGTNAGPRGHGRMPSACS